MVQVDRVLLLLQRAFRTKSKVSVIKRIEDWAPAKAREALLTHETLAGYRTNAKIECHVGPALLFLEYLIAHRTSVRDATAANTAQRACESILERSRKRRFERSAVQEYAVEGSVINRHSGAYALIRMESRIGQLCEELIILCPPEGNEKARHACLIGRNLIMRGHWHLVGSSIYVSGVGYKPRHQPDFMTVSFSKADLEADIMGGVLTGLTTEHREPVTMSVIVTKIRDFEPSFARIVDRSDPEIIRNFVAVVPKRLAAVQRGILDEVHDQVLSEQPKGQAWWFEQKVINPTDAFVAGIRAREDWPRLVLPGLVKFLSKK